MERFRNRLLEGEDPYVWLDAKATKLREHERALSRFRVRAVITGRASAGASSWSPGSSNGRSPAEGQP